MKLGRGRTPADGSWVLLLRRCSPEVNQTRTALSARQCPVRERQVSSGSSTLAVVELAGG